MTTENGPVAVLNLPTKPGELSTFARLVLAALTGNANLPTPDPTLAVFEADCDALDLAIKKAAAKGPGAVADRKAKTLKVVKNLKRVRNYVQTVVDTVVVPADAITMILSAHLSVRKGRPTGKAELAAHHGAVSGEVELVAKALTTVAMYYWQLSLDQKAWTNVPEAFKASVTITGLTPGQVYYFRFRTTTRKRASDFSQVVSLMVL